MKRLGAAALITLFFIAIPAAAQWCTTPFSPAPPQAPQQPNCPPPNPFLGNDNTGNSCPICKGSPCLPSTGSYTTAAIDLQLAAGVPLAIGRNYESAMATDGPLGIGWTL